MGLKEKITDKIESFEVGRKLVHNPRHRVIYGAAFGLSLTCFTLFTTARRAF